MVEVATIKNYEDYFSQLSVEERSKAPKELFFEGNFDLLTSGVRASVVGSRKLSDEGKKRAELITKALVEREIIVVSGLAEGVDTIAHTTAINQKGSTITVLGTPLSKCTPVSNKSLLSEIKKNHLAVSQFKEGSFIGKGNFPKRNLTMALISDATIIIEASENSGTRHQAWEAIRLGRPVFILESLVKEKNLEWANKAVEYGAIILTRENYQNIFDELKEFSFVTF